jgi:hypothetical protein
LNRRPQLSGIGHPITFVRVAERQLHFTDVDPITCHLSLLQMRKRNAPHPAAVAVGITARADDKMLWHEATLEANAQHSTRLRELRRRGRHRTPTVEIQIPDVRSYGTMLSHSSGEVLRLPRHSLLSRRSPAKDDGEGGWICVSAIRMAFTCRGGQAPAEKFKEKSLQK